MNPRVSVIIPAHNTEKYIVRAVESALAQTEPDIEVLVVDDASTDGTVDVIEGFSDARLRLMINDRNRGPSYTRNRAIREARGEWIALLDSDDWFAPERIEKLLGAARKKDADLVADDMYLIQDGARHPWSTLLSLGDARFDGISRVSAADFVNSNMPGRRCSRLGLTKPLIRRDFLNRHRFAYKEDVRFGEDFLFYLNCLLKGACFVVVPEPYYFYRRRQGSLVTEDKLESLASLRRETLRLMRQEPVMKDPELARSLAERLSVIERRLLYFRVVRPFKEGDFARALVEALRNPRFLPLFLMQMPANLRHRMLRVSGKMARRVG